MKPDFPPGFAYDKKKPWFVGSEKTETVRGGYRGLALFAMAEKKRTGPGYAGASGSTFYRYDESFHVSVDLSRPVEYLALAPRPDTSWYARVFTPEEFDKSPDPLDAKKIDFFRSLSIGYPPFDDTFIVSADNVALARQLIRPEVVQWMLGDSRSRDWKVTLLESKAWLSQTGNQCDAERVFRAADYLIDLAQHLQPYVVLAMAGTPS